MEKQKTMKPETIVVLKESGLNLAGGLGGVIVGSALGTWPSLLAGLATTLTGAYYNKTWLMTSGVAMAVSVAPRLRNEDNVEGFQDEVDNARGRVVNTLKMLGRKIMLHKVSPQMAKTMELNGAEDTLMLEGHDLGEFDTSEVDNIIRQLEEGNADMISGTASVDGYLEGLGGVDMSEIEDLALSATA